MSHVEQMDSTQWDDRYQKAAASAGLWSTEPARLLQDTIGQLAARGSALDIATGDGRNALWLARRGWATTAVDFSREGLRLAADRAERAGVGVEWLCEDIRTWRPGRRFDLITMTYLHLETEAANLGMIATAGDWLAPGGTLFVLGHDRDNLSTGAPGPRSADALYTADLLRRAAVGLDIIAVSQVARHTATDPEAAGEPETVAIDTVLHAVKPA